MKFTKLLSLLLCLCMVVAVFAACSGGGEEDSSKEDVTVDGGDTGNEELNAALQKVIDTDLDMGGDPLAFLIQEPLSPDFNIMEQDDATDALTQAVYDRNLEFEAAYNVELEFYEVENRGVSTSPFKEAFETDIESGDALYDLAFYDTHQLIPMAIGGYLYDFLDIPGLNLDDSWWDQGTKEFIIQDSIWFMNGAFSMSADETTFVVLYNKEIYDDKVVSVTGGKSFYDSVDDGSWTFEYLYEVSKHIPTDMNGDTAMNYADDMFGFVMTDAFNQSAFYASGLKYIEFDNDDIATITFDGGDLDKAQTLIEKITPLYDPNYSVIGTVSNPSIQEGREVFTSGRGLFYGEVVSHIHVCNEEMSTDFGILPVPKFDEDQEEYISWMHGEGETLIISKLVKDEEALGELIYGFNVLSEKHVQPAYYDVILGSNSVRDEESGPMLDMIFENRVYDLAMYIEGFPLSSAFSNGVKNGTFASEYNSQKDNAEKKLEEIMGYNE